MESYSICPFVVACGRISFLAEVEWHSVVWMDHIVFLCSSVDGHWGRWQLWAIVKSAAVDVGVQISAQIPAFNV